MIALMVMDLIAENGERFMIFFIIYVLSFTICRFLDFWFKILPVYAVKDTLLITF